MRKRELRPVGAALDAVTARLAPPTTLAAVQRVWPRVVGATVAREARPVRESGGEVLVDCRSAVWAQELDLLSEDLVERLNVALGTSVVTRVRTRATLSDA